MSDARNTLRIAPPIGLLAELTHRCPLGCPYCSNPLELETRAGELDAPGWGRVFAEAAALGVLQVHLSGGEPASRRDLIDIVGRCAKAGLYSNLITSGIGLTETSVLALGEAGLDHIQLSIQDCDEASADRIAGYRGAFAKKRQVAAWVVASGMPLTVNAVIHRANVARATNMVAMAIELGARRVEIAHTQYYGWGLANRAALMPTRQEADAAWAAVEAMRPRLEGRIVIDHVAPDYHARTPKPCMGGWGSKTLNVSPSGKALPCHAAEMIPGLEFWNVKDHSLAEIWRDSPAFNAFRGTDWMREPCRSCDRREIDYGGCRCQALAVAGDARATDPACHLSPNHHLIAAIANADSAISGDPAYRYRAPVRALQKA
jgi:pyrroloquinoline quinone biosynthesis protein E